MKSSPQSRRSSLAFAILLTLAGASAMMISSDNVSAQTTINSTWVGDVNGNGTWSYDSFWDPTGVPNNSSADNYNVTIAYKPTLDFANGPTIDDSFIIDNLTLVNRASINDPSFNYLIVNGTTSLTTTAGHSGEYGFLSLGGGGAYYVLGTLTNFNSTTKTLEGGGYLLTGDSTIEFHGADIVTNNAFLFIAGAGVDLNTHLFIINQDNFQNALFDLAVNNGTVQFVDGYNFTTGGNFTNNSLLAVGLGGDTHPTTFTVSGSLTNFDTATKTLTGGNFTVDGSSQTATLRFPNADIQYLSNVSLYLYGDWHITDLNGLDAFRNLRGITNCFFSSSGTQTFNPPTGLFTNNNSTHRIDTGANITIQGSYNVTNGGTLLLNGPADNSNTSLLVTGSGLLMGGGLDMGGQPGVNTLYSTKLEFRNGIEFRGAYITGAGTVFADLLFTQSAHVKPGHSPGELDVEGSIGMDSSTVTEMQIGGLTAGTDYDWIKQTGTKSVTLGGYLHVQLINGFASSVSNSNTFDIITSGHPILGSFANVASGSRLATDNGEGSFLVTYAGQNMVRLSGFIPALRLTAGVSRKTHIGIGPFDIPLALTGSPSVECRGISGNHTLIFTFNNNVSSGSATLTAPKGGSVSGTASFSGNTMTVNLTGVTNAQIVTVHLSGVTDAFAQVLPNTDINIGMLTGDVSGEGTVNSGDATITRSRSGHPTDGTNFRADVNTDGSVNSGDATAVRARSGNSIY